MALASCWTVTAVRSLVRASRSPWCRLWHVMGGGTGGFGWEALGAAVASATDRMELVLREAVPAGAFAIALDRVSHVFDGPACLRRAGRWRVGAYEGRWAAQRPSPHGRLNVSRQAR